MYANYNPNTVEDKIMVAECPRVSGYITRKSYRGLCCMPTEIGGSSTIRYSDYFVTNAGTSRVLFVRNAGGSKFDSTNAGASFTGATDGNTFAHARYTSPLCYFTADPIIP